MMKRTLALLLCLATLLLCFTACSHGEDDKGAYIRMYLSEPVYNLDPLEAYDNAAAMQVVTLLFEGLFYQEEDGKVKKGLVDDYEYTKDEDEGEYLLNLTLRETYWSDGVQMTANDVVYACRRLFQSSHPATALLYDVKNARAIVSGENVDHLAVTVVESDQVEFAFERDIDVEGFLVSLCSPALYPVRDDIVDVHSTWAQSKTNMVCSGPFMVRSMEFDTKDGFILERNSYYYRDRLKDDLDKYVTPYRIVVDYSTPAIDQMALYKSKEAGGIYYFGYIPFAARSKDSDYHKLAKKADAINGVSTHAYYLNVNAEPLTKPEVRRALSMAIDRDAIVEALMFAEEATGLVPNTILYRADKDKTFRDKASKLIKKSAKMDDAKELLAEAGVTPAGQTITITVAAYDEEHVATAELVKTAWTELGFTVEIEKLDVVKNKATNLWDNDYKAALAAGDFQVIALDVVAPSADAFSMLAPFAKPFSGNATNLDIAVNPNYDLTPHITGYNSEAYNAKIEEAFAETNLRKRAKLVEEAEEMLLNDMPVIPIVFNQYASLCAGKLDEPTSTFFCPANFMESKLSGYWKIALRDGFVVEKEEEAPAE